jgi:hypothetical protein
MTEERLALRATIGRMPASILRRGYGAASLSVSISYVLPG